MSSNCNHPETREKTDPISRNVWEVCAECGAVVEHVEDLGKAPHPEPAGMGVSR